MTKTSPTSLDDEFHLIAALEKNPTLSQRDLASVLGFSVGKVNYCLKALIDKGLIKAGRFAQNPNKAQYAYLLTPQGIASKAALTAHFLERKMAQYEALKAEISALKAQPVDPLEGAQRWENLAGALERAPAGVPERVPARAPARAPASVTKNGPA